jgi:hypothetical protein
LLEKLDPENHVAIGEISIPLLLISLSALATGPRLQGSGQFSAKSEPNVPNRRIIGKQADSFFEFHGSLPELALFAKDSAEVAVRFAALGIGLDGSAQLCLRSGEIAIRQQQRSQRLVALGIASIQLEAGAVLRKQYNKANHSHLLPRLLANNRSDTCLSTLSSNIIYNQLVLQGERNETYAA